MRSYFVHIFYFLWSPNSLFLTLFAIKSFLTTSFVIWSSEFSDTLSLLLVFYFSAFLEATMFQNNTLSWVHRLFCKYYFLNHWFLLIKVVFIVRWALTAFAILWSFFLFDFRNFGYDNYHSGPLVGTINSIGLLLPSWSFMR